MAGSRDAASASAPGNKCPEESIVSVMAWSLGCDRGLQSGHQVGLDVLRGVLSVFPAAGLGRHESLSENRVVGWAFLPVMRCSDRLEGLFPIQEQPANRQSAALTRPQANLNHSREKHWILRRPPARSVGFPRASSPSIHRARPGSKPASRTPVGRAELKRFPAGHVAFQRRAEDRQREGGHDRHRRCDRRIGLCRVRGTKHQTQSGRILGGCGLASACEPFGSAAGWPVTDSHYSCLSCIRSPGAGIGEQPQPAFTPSPCSA